MKKNEIIAGLFSGLLTILLFIIAYAIDPKWMLHPALYWGSLVLFVLGMLGACLLEKRRGEGVLSFRKGVRTGFITFLIANGLFWIFYFLMFTLVDPSLPEIQKEMMRAYYEQQLTGKDLREQLKLMEQGDFGIEISTIFQGFARGAIGGFILSLLLSLAVRQEA